MWYFPFLPFPKKLSAVKPFYTFAVKRSEHPEKILYQRKHYHPCPNRSTGNFHVCFNVGFMGQWNAEEIVINYKAENPAEDLRKI